MPENKQHHSTEVLPAIPDYLQGLPVLNDMEALVERSIQRTLSAKTAEEVLSDPDSAGLRDYAGRFVIVNTIAGIVPSAIREGDWYVVFDGLDEESGELVTFTTGSSFVMSRLVRLAELGALPRRVRVLELESASNKGQSSLWIVDADPKSKRHARDAAPSDDTF